VKSEWSLFNIIASFLARSLMVFYVKDNKDGLDVIVHKEQKILDL